jgi:hypothetical protein
MDRSPHVSAEDIAWELTPGASQQLDEMTVEDIAVAALQESQSYRLLAQQALHLLRAQEIQLRQLSVRHRRLVEQFRTENRLNVRTTRRGVR